MTLSGYAVAICLYNHTVALVLWCICKDNLFEYKCPLPNATQDFIDIAKKLDLPNWNLLAGSEEQDSKYSIRFFKQADNPFIHLEVSE